jgi:hypothetical protein
VLKFCAQAAAPASCRARQAAVIVLDELHVAPAARHGIPVAADHRAREGPHDRAVCGCAALAGIVSGVETGVGGVEVVGFER